LRHYIRGIGADRREAITPYFDEGLADEIAEFEESENDDLSIQREHDAEAIGDKATELEPTIRDTISSCKLNKVGGRSRNSLTPLMEVIPLNRISRGQFSTGRGRSNPLLDTQLS